MVRINVGIDPKKLTDQHLIAEYKEILQLAGYTRKFPEIKDIQEEYTLFNPYKFFKDKWKYLSRRHKILIKEMKRRGFRTNCILDLSEIPVSLINDYTPKKSEIILIKKRIKQRISEKPKFYRYYRQYRDEKFLKLLVK